MAKLRICPQKRKHTPSDASVALFEEGSLSYVDLHLADNPHVVLLAGFARRGFRCRITQGQGTNPAEALGKSPLFHQGTPFFGSEHFPFAVDPAAAHSQRMGRQHHVFQYATGVLNGIFRLSGSEDQHEGRRTVVRVGRSIQRGRSWPRVVRSAPGFAQPRYRAIGHPWPMEHMCRLGGWLPVVRPRSVRDGSCGSCAAFRSGAENLFPWRILLCFYSIAKIRKAGRKVERENEGFVERKGKVYRGSSPFPQVQTMCRL